MSKFKWPIKLTKFGMVRAFTTHPHLKGHSQIALLKFLCFCFKFFGTGLSKYNYISSRSHQIYRKIIIDSAPSFPFSILSVSSLDALYLYSLCNQARHPVQDSCGSDSNVLFIEDMLGPVDAGFMVPLHRETDIVSFAYK